MSFWITAIFLVTTTGSDGIPYAPNASAYMPRESCLAAEVEIEPNRQPAAVVHHVNCRLPGKLPEHYVQMFASEYDCLLANSTAEGSGVSYQGKPAARQCVRVTMDKVSSEPPSPL